MNLDPTLLGIALAGAVFGYFVYQARWGRPWGGVYRSASDRLAKRIARSAPAVARQSEVAAQDVAAVEAFYTRWVNLPREEREGHRESLRSEGIDMIRLGDSLRWYRDRG